MSEKLKESLSAVIDGEADEFELRRVLDEVGKDAGLQQSWERYHLIGAVMRRERVIAVESIRDAVWNELQTDEEVESAVVDVPLPPEPSDKPDRGRWTAAAVAATVALAVVIGYLQVNSGDGSALDVPAVAGAPGVLGNAAGGPLEVAGAALAQPEAQEVALKSEISVSDQLRTDAYKIYHMQQVGMSQSGFSGFARMVSYERE
jgi:sigma-E factor negative regulatory protein RseA